MSADIDANAVAELLVEARQLLARISDDLAPIASKPGRCPTDAVADLLDLADRVQETAADIYQRVRHVAQIKAQGAGGTIVSPSGIVGWTYISHGNALAGGRRGHLRRLTAAELEEATRGPQ